jgi:endonuclease YncB( thermonuclease family)
MMAIPLALAACDPGQAAGVVLAPSAGATFACNPARVSDGGSFTCSDGRKVRLAGIAAREVR